MAAIPEAPPTTFELPVRVRFCETDANGHVSQLSYLIYFEEARTEVMDAMRSHFQWFTGDRTLVLARQWAEYLRPVYFPDRLTVKTTVVKVGTSSLRMAHVIIRNEDQDPVCRGESVMVLVTSQTGRSTPWPEALRTAFLQVERPETALPF